MRRDDGSVDVVRLLAGSIAGWLHQLTATQNPTRTIR
jgi:hypothetical protein